MQSERVIRQGDKFRVQIEDGSLLRGRFNRRDEAEEARLRRVAARVLAILDPGRDNLYSSRAAARSNGVPVIDLPGYRPRA